MPIYTYFCKSQLIIRRYIEMKERKRERDRKEIVRMREREWERER